MRRATIELRTCVADWHGGAGVLVAEPPSNALAVEVHELGRGLRALAEPAVAESYLALFPSPNPEKGE